MPTTTEALYIHDNGEVAHKRCGGSYLANADDDAVIRTPLGGWLRVPAGEVDHLRCEKCGER